MTKAISLENLQEFKNKCDETYAPIGGGGGTTVIANNGEATTETLQTLKVGDTNYEVPQGGGSGGTQLYKYTVTYPNGKFTAVSPTVYEKGHTFNMFNQISIFLSECVYISVIVSGAILRLTAYKGSFSPGGSYYTLYFVNINNTLSTIQLNEGSLISITEVKPL